MPVHVVATQSHWADHLAPVWLGLPDDLRGHYYTFPAGMGYAMSLGIDAEALPTWPRFQRHDRVIVAAESDRRRIQTVPVIRFEHGIGGSFAGDKRTATHPSYAGGSAQRNVRLFCCTNGYSYDRWQAAYPRVSARIVGTPKMDRWHNAPPKPRASKPVVCISFHFDATVSPETRSAFKYYQRVIPEIARRDDITFVAHAHPKARRVRQPFYEDLGVEFLPRFDQVLERADVYVIDSFSTLYEFASVNRPVVVLNAPFFRRHINHGLRFWELSDVGVNCDTPAGLSAAIDAALEDPPEQQEKRQRASDVLYPYRGHATERTVEVIQEHFARQGKVGVRV